MVRLPTLITQDSTDAAVHVLARYYGQGDREGRFEGRFFDTWGRQEGDQDRFTPQDLLSVSFLSVNVPPEVVRDLLSEDAGNASNALLAEISPTARFWDEPPTPDSPQWQLEDELRRHRHVGLTKASKLMARKRPHLVPVLDRVVVARLHLQKGAWRPLYEQFSQESFRDQLHRIVGAARQAGVRLPPDLALLRIFDVLVWMDATQAGLADSGHERRGDQGGR